MKDRLALTYVFLTVFFLTSCDLFFTDVSGLLEQSADAGNKGAVLEHVVEGLKYELQSDGTYSLSGSVSNIEPILIIPPSVNGIKVSRISKNAFFNNRYLKEVFIPSSISSIGDNAFSGAKSLQSVTIENGVQEIGNRAFSSIGVIESIIVPGSVSFVGENAFENSFLDIYLDIPDFAVSPWDPSWDTSVVNRYNWDAWHEVKFNTKGGSPVSPLPVLVSSNTIKKLPVPEKTGCVFDGWYLGQDYKNKFNEGVSRVSADITLIAKWVE